MKKLVLLFLLALLLPSRVKALKEFETTYQINYSVDNRGQITVEQEITLTNNLANIYPKEYLIETSQEIVNISAWDQQGSILKGIDKNKERVKIKLEFNQEVIGRGKSLSFTVKYQLKSLAVHKGRVWEINLPKLSNSQDIDYLGTSVTVPNSFGKLAYSSVKIQKITSLATQTKFILSRNQADQAATLSFGDFQSFDFSLQYQLENPDLETWEFLIAIPPITNYQEVILTDIRPLPKEIKIDKNGNWLAHYRVEPHQTLPVLVEGQAKVFAIPQAVDFYNQEKNFASFLKEDKYWETSNAQIIQLAKELKTPKKIYQYVVSRLDYNYLALENNTVSRRGALSALNQSQQSVCSEFTDLFITLARAAGIPAREIEGFAYTNNPKLKPLSLKKDILHAWPEYWDNHKKQWIQIDPTWEKTTGGVDYFDHFDFNHLTFVIHGDQSIFPPPPGTYTSSQTKEVKSIKVAFSNKQVILPPNEELLEKITLEFTRNKDKQFWFWQAKNSQIVVKNNTLYPIKQILVQNQVISLLPPWGKETITLETEPFWQQFLFSPQKEITISLANTPHKRTTSLVALTPKEANLRQIILIFLIINGAAFSVVLIIKLVNKVAKKS